MPYIVIELLVEIIQVSSVSFIAYLQSQLTTSLMIRCQAGEMCRKCNDKWCIGPKPDPPFNVSAQLLMDGALNIAWLPPKHSIVPVHHYIIEYRTVGQWVPLVNDVERVFYKFKRPSRGATYHFRVISCTESGIQSEYSPVYTIKTTGNLQHVDTDC